MRTPTTREAGLGRDEGRTRRLARRGLLRGLATGGAAAALGGQALAVGTESAPDGASAEGDHRRLGFRATDHMRWFYHRARW